MTSLAAPLNFTQRARTLGVETPLGPDKVLLRSFVGREAVSEPFRFELDLLSEDHLIDFAGIIGAGVSFRVLQADGLSHRWFHGHVSRFSQLPREGRFSVYRAEVVPWLWFLTRTYDCKIFQQKTVPDIVAEVFATFGFADHEFRLSRSYRTWDYCVQYRETAFNFVSRLLEQEGIYYYFRHEHGRHTLILGDAPPAHDPCAAFVRYRHAEDGSADAGEVGSINAWAVTREFRPGRWALNDFNFTMPRANLLVQSESIVNTPGADRYEVYDHPGEYENRGEGDAYVRTRMEEEEAGHLVVRGRGFARTLAAGHRFQLVDHDRPDQNTMHTLLEVVHVAEEGGTYTGTESVPRPYENRFVCIPHTTPFRPARTTPKPMIQGGQTALVVGPAGEEIWTDSYGRVKVHFWWDRYGKRDGNDSCWIRVSQLWAGKGWGAMWIPRIGQEVIVEHLEGDPDRPIIVGRVYNDSQVVPYPLPAEQTKSTIKSNSSKGGDGFNEIRFEDKAGAEQIFVHGQKDQDIRIRNDRREWIGNNRHLIVVHDKRELVGGDKHIRVVGEQQESIDRSLTQPVGDSLDLSVGSDRTESVGSGYDLGVGSDLTVSVGKDINIGVGKGRKDGVGMDYEISVGKDMKTQIGGDEGRLIGGKLAVETADAYHLTVGESWEIKVSDKWAAEAEKEIHHKSGKKICIEAGDEITLKAKGGFIKIDKSGVIIQGKKVKINSGGSPGKGGGADPESPEPGEPPGSAASAQPAQPIPPDPADNAGTGIVSAPI
jgi:type VI secretion system secreted protein VgrG